MATWLKQSTAADIAIGPFLDSGDGVTAETGLTLTQPDIRLKKNGGAWAQKNAAQTLSHEENGWYELALDATDTATLGILIVAVNESGALPVWREFMVVAANIYDSVVGGGDVLDVSVTQWLGTAAATPSVAGVPEVDLTHVNGAATTATLDTVKSETAAILADTGTDIPASITSLASQLTTIDNFVDTEVAAILAAVDTEVAAIKAKTDLIPASIPTADENADGLLDKAAGVETGFTVRQTLRLMAAVLLGKASGMDTTTAIFRDLADSKDRISAVVDSDGNRTSVTRDAT